MKRHLRVSMRYIKVDWGSGRMTWRIAPIDLRDKIYKKPHKITLRRLKNQEAKKAWFNGSSIKAY